MAHTKRKGPRLKKEFVHANAEWYTRDDEVQNRLKSIRHATGDFNHLKEKHEELLT